MNYSSGNRTVDLINEINFSGNLIPTAWYKTIIRENGKPYLNAIIILSDLIFWYKPTEVRDEITGQFVGYKKKFKADILQRNYQQISELFGMSKTEARNAIVYLENLGVLKRVFRNIKTDKGTTLSNVMFIDLNPEVIKVITFPKDDDLDTNTELITSKENNSETFEEVEADKIDNNTTETNLTDENQLKDVQKQIKTNIGYDDLMKSRGEIEKEKIDGIYQLMQDVLTQNTGTIKINSSEIPIEVAKSQFWKLNYWHINYVLDSLKKANKKIKNIRSYMLTTLYNAPITKDYYYDNWVRSTMYNQEE